MFVLFTDFGLEGPYVGQMKAVLHQGAPGVPVVDLMHDVPACDPRAAAYLLAAYAPAFPEGSVFAAVVDPGVGGDRRPVVLQAGGRWYVGPDNGLFALIVRHADSPRAWQIAWRPERLSSSFHGRDLFAPVAAHIASEAGAGALSWGVEIDPGSLDRADFPGQLAEIIYIDRFGNGISGLAGENFSPNHRFLVHNVEIKGETTFSSVPVGSLFWYVNSNGLVEFACNRGRADCKLSLAVGTAIGVDVNQPVTVVT